MSVFVDTSAFLAMLDGADLNHSRADRVWKELLAVGEPLVTTNYVLLETFALAQRRLGMEAVTEFCALASPIMVTKWVDQPTHDAGVAAVLAAGRRKLSLVDCVSFEVMRRAAIRRAFAFDPHFLEAGFEVIPGV
jgi:uncharacterized protein